MFQKTTPAFVVYLVTFAKVRSGAPLEGADFAVDLGELTPEQAYAAALAAVHGKQVIEPWPEGNLTDRLKSVRTPKA